MSELITLNSGGAIGADTVFGDCAKKAGHKVIHFMFEGMETEVDKKDRLYLSNMQLRLADEALKKANKTLGRTFPSRNNDTNNLLRRNFWQIQNTQAVYAVAPLYNERYVQGGTAWAIQMAIDRGIKEIHLFNLEDNEWYSFLSGKWHQVYALPPVTIWNTYTGIGKRKITPTGIKAIENLYVK